MKADETLKPDNVYSVAFDIAAVMVELAFRGALYAISVAALCPASIVYVLQAWTSPWTMTPILVLLAIVAGIAALALRQASRLQAEIGRRDEDHLLRAASSFSSAQRRLREHQRFSAEVGRMNSIARSTTHYVLLAGAALLCCVLYLGACIAALGAGVVAAMFIVGAMATVAAVAAMLVLFAIAALISWCAVRYAGTLEDWIDKKAGAL